MSLLTLTIRGYFMQKMIDWIDNNFRVVVVFLVAICVAFVVGMSIGLALRSINSVVAHDVKVNAIENVVGESIQDQSMDRVVALEGRVDVIEGAVLQILRLHEAESKSADGFGLLDKGGGSVDTIDKNIIESEIRKVFSGIEKIIIVEMRNRYNNWGSSHSTQALVDIEFGDNQKRRFFVYFKRQIGDEYETRFSAGTWGPTFFHVNGFDIDKELLKGYPKPYSIDFPIELPNPIPWLFDEDGNSLKTD